MKEIKSPQKPLINLLLLHRVAHHPAIQYPGRTATVVRAGIRGGLRHLHGHDRAAAVAAAWLFPDVIAKQIHGLLCSVLVSHYGKKKSYRILTLIPPLPLSLTNLSARNVLNTKAHSLFPHFTCRYALYTGLLHDLNQRPFTSFAINTTKSFVAALTNLGYHNVSIRCIMNARCMAILHMLVESDSHLPQKQIADEMNICGR